MMKSARVFVSIPFKREGVSEHQGAESNVLTSTRFLFPSNGKAFLNLVQNANIVLDQFIVSISFKRDGVSELSEHAQLVGAVIYSFLFPSNGKAFLNRRRRTLPCGESRVSIPFKRDGVSELIEDSTHPADGRTVSIPFKRDGVSEL